MAVISGIYRGVHAVVDQEAVGRGSGDAERGTHLPKVTGGKRKSQGLDPLVLPGQGSPGVWMWVRRGLHRVLPRVVLRSLAPVASLPTPGAL